MKLQKFIFIEALICDARWYDVTKGESDEVRQRRVEELWNRFKSFQDKEVPISKSLMIHYIEETIYSEL